MPNATADGHAEEEYELAPLMGELQRHSAKLGYSIEAQNGPLAAFYVAELKEMLDEIEAIDTHDGMPIGKPTEVIMRGPVGAVEKTVAAADWTASASAYGEVITACNRCHLATQHGFIEILPATGPAPFNQRF